MSRTARIGRITIRIAGLIVVTLSAAIVFTSRAADPTLWPPAKNDETVGVLLVSNGFHSGLVLPLDDLLRVADERRTSAVREVVRRFGSYPFVEFGWGEEKFYRNTPTVPSIDPVLALRALFWPFTSSVVHVVGISGRPEDFFANAEQVAVAVSKEGFARIVAKLDATFRRDADGDLRQIGPGLYGPSLFYPARGHFSILYNCNRWASEMLAAAGLPSSAILSLVSQIFVASLRHAMRRAQQ